MEHLKMHSMNKVDENVSKIATLFPNCVTEAKNENGELTHKIDFDMLKQELSNTLVEGREERYQFTWPDKKQAILTANAPINKTLRPCRKESVNFDNTENIYIEGDNLEALKLLQETYLGKIKMIYIDPPYNTGNDFVYADDFAQEAADYIANSGQIDNDGNRLVANTESNGRFHTDWLNMMYPRLKLSRDLLTPEGVLFISISETEVDNTKKMCIEVFGEKNVIATLVRKTKTTSNNGNQFAPSHEYIVVCAKDINTLNGFNDPEAQADEDYIKLFRNEDDYGKYNVIGLYQPALKHGGSTYPIECPDGSFVITPDNKPWRWNEQTFLKNKADNRVVFKETKTSPLLDLNGNKAKWNIYTKLYLKDRLEAGMRPITFIDKYTNSEASKELIKMEIPFDFSKPRRLIQYLMKICIADKDSIILDFFSGSATTAHAVLQLNAEDGANRRFIMVQLPELTDEKSEAYKAGYKNICEIGKERIRRAGKIIKEESPLTTETLDTGFRVFKIDSSNMEDVYYTPDHIDTNDLFKNNIKSDRTGEDLLFQTMLDLGIMLSSKIETKKINSKEVFCVEGNYLMACLDDSVDEKTITEIAKEKPYYFVMRDPTNSKDGDSLITNFEQIFTTYSPDTVRKVL